MCPPRCEDSCAERELEAVNDTKHAPTSESQRHAEIGRRVVPIRDSITDLTYPRVRANPRVRASPIWATEVTKTLGFPSI